MLCLGVLFICFFCCCCCWLHCTACEILAPQPRTEPGPSAVRMCSPKQWTIKEFPQLCDILEKANFENSKGITDAKWYGERGINRHRRGLSGQPNSSVWYYNGGWISWYISQNPENMQYQEWALMEVMGFGWSYWMKAASLAVPGDPSGVGFW